ncbi:phosphoenolpyruvate-protein phosphotransferase [Aggregatibacter actinomycetemcomitans serotype e str. SC1083]|uniref:Phosphoenolpyruvate-protein phosphotransferase n=1 Tax=Aggregatibacter actinomycetemcomitans serotype e str. SC1083 TaxID=907488 RepID=G4A696_AGGAC|nr:phosphoenolpyruvate-protein phosphotransferase PtsI [Aggregatibacter actinomycetemcomitans]EGY34861.1 phosphoenolpyruvate-protein phosphotransferase [Aggregatibacter actinomycetemcomitans serotype e str. SC1083]KYK74656.1 phosphoenolpyruvate-protein phosphotransferase [Aggregatibacter actinomycetemcomitans serotype e str. SA3096]KYK81485.1 phosphoenolpyruvate-protein phosphotransferase [Aggregatibacter actinomycetemcomitans serotype e str. SC936]TYB21796.1 phosphoenolpyruvate-protein phospho
MISGIPASPGIVFGKALVLKEEKIVLDTQKIKDSQIEDEVARFYAGRDAAVEQLNSIKDRAYQSLGEEKAAIFEGHLMILEDEELEEEIIDYLRSNHVNAAVAANVIIDQQVAMLSEIDDEYLKERAGDIRDIGNRLIKNILGMHIVDLGEINEEAILVAYDLTPSETAQLNLDKVLGFVTDIGGRTSHTSIMARSLELPAIVGTNNVTHKVNTGDYLILDALNNVVYVNPSQEEIQRLKALQAKLAEEKAELAKLKDLPALTLDGHRVDVVANIGTIRDVEGAERNGAEGVGLYRTEFLFMDRDQLPTEEEQFIAYKEVVEAMNGNLVVLRTMDIGGDKELPYLNLPKEMNPFLGWRAIRIALDRREILHAQLRAVLRASAYGKLAVMFPMIISVEEIRELKSVVEKLKVELRNEGKAFDEDIQIGVMVETPAAAVNAGFLAKEVDFFSIGTNDLTQYTLAVDRGNELISHLYNPMSPSVLNLIKQVIDASHAEGKWTGMCGELAGDERATILLLGMGLDEFSMSAISVPRIKKLIRNVNFQDAKALAEKALQQPTAAEIESLVSDFLSEKALN